MRFHVREHKNFAGKAVSLECDERKLLKKIITCANPSDRSHEETELLKNKYVLSPLRTERDFPLRFFLTVQLNNEFRPRTLQMFAREFVAALEAETRAKAVSHYLGTGDFHLLLKLRLARFEELRDVLRVFEETSDDLPAQDVSSRSQTFVEVDQEGLIESDDGSIIAELNRLRGEK